MTSIAAEMERFNRLSLTCWQPDGPMSEPLAMAAGRSGLAQTDSRDMAYNPFRHTPSWCQRTHVNYISVFTLGKATPQTFTHRQALPHDLH